MGIFALKHKENILYREDDMKTRVELLYRWTSSGEVSLDEFEVLIESCNDEQIKRDKERRYGKVCS